MLLKALFTATTLLGGLAVAQPVAAPDAAPVSDVTDISDALRLTHDAHDLFPQTMGNLSAFSIDSLYSGYNATEKSWLLSQNPASGKDDTEKAEILTGLAYGKPFDGSEEDMVDYRDAVLAAVAGKSLNPAVRKRSMFNVSSHHAVNWHNCAVFFACMAGSNCKFKLNVNHAPRSVCKKIGSDNCCLSWSDYNVTNSFFEYTWSSCNTEVTDDRKTNASCQGDGGSKYGGDVCFSNRSTGCT